MHCMNGRESELYGGPTRLSLTIRTVSETLGRLLFAPHQPHKLDRTLNTIIQIVARCEFFCQARIRPGLLG
jgi:hypothetical protein